MFYATLIIAVGLFIVLRSLRSAKPPIEDGFAPGRDIPTTVETQQRNEALRAVLQPRIAVAPRANDELAKRLTRNARHAQKAAAKTKHASTYRHAEDVVHHQPGLPPDLNRMLYGPGLCSPRD